MEASKHIALDPEQLPIHFAYNYVNGQYHHSSGKGSLTLFNPKDDTLVATNVPIASQQDVDEAVELAEAAFQGPWSRFTSSQRSECLRRLADILEDELPSILRLDSLTTGNPVSLIPTREKNYIKSCLLYYGESLGLAVIPHSSTLAGLNSG